MNERVEAPGGFLYALLRRLIDVRREEIAALV